MKYRIQQIGLDVVLSQTDPVQLEWARQNIYTLSEEQADEIQQFVNEHELGRRTAWDRWRLNNRKCMTIFMLKYG